MQSAGWSVWLAALAVTVGLMGCGPEEPEPEDAATLQQPVGPCSDAPTQADVNAPAFLYYGRYADDAALHQITQRTLGEEDNREVILALNNATLGCYGPTHATAQAWQAWGPDDQLSEADLAHKAVQQKWVKPAKWRAADPARRKVAAVFNACQLMQSPKVDPWHHLTVERAKQVLHAGFAYIAIDEVALKKERTKEQKAIAKALEAKVAKGGTLTAEEKKSLAKIKKKCTYGAKAWRNGGDLSNKLVALLEGLAAEGYDRRVILYMNTYNLFDHGKPKWKQKKSVFADYSHVLDAMRDHGRLLGAEMYIATKYANGQKAPDKTHCNRDPSCLNNVARQLEKAAPGITGRTITVLGVSDNYNRPDNPRSLCGRGGALYEQYAELHRGTHTRRQPGVGGYTLGDVPGTQGFDNKQAKCLGDLNGWAFPRAGAPAHSCDQTFAVTLRDFRQDHPDFEVYAGTAPTTGLVFDDLGPFFVPVHRGEGATAMTSGPGTFDEWYRDVPGVNRTFDSELTLEQVTAKLWRFDSNAFFPLDGVGFGNEGNAHNYHFTTELRAWFTYEGHETFTFEGDDDLWLFVNDRLALDLGGTHPEASGTVKFAAKAKELGLKKGGTYPMDIFHAERHRDHSNFRIETNVSCFDPPK